jgi:hypothetical protein
MLFYGIIPARIMGIRFSHYDTEKNKMSQSEVARLLQEIELSYQAAKNGMHGLAEGTAQHAFITAKMERIEEHRESLVKLVGAEQAMELITQALERV